MIITSHCFLILILDAHLFVIVLLFVYRKSHFLAGLVIHEITACLHRDKLIRSEVRRHRPLYFNTRTRL
jgi:hypothetical protein